MQVDLCVMALVRGEVAAVQPNEIQNHLLKQTVYTVASVYDEESRADWCPFGNDHNIVDYIREKGFVPANRPLNLAQIAETGDSYTLLKEVSIFVIDPLFLALNSVPNDFLNQLAGVLLGDCKFYCVLLPEGLSPELSEKLKSTAKEKLRLAYEDYDKTGRGRWFVRDAAEFRSYLTEHLKPKLKVCQKGRQMTRSGTPQLNMTLEELLSRAADPD